MKKDYEKIICGTCKKEKEVPKFRKQKFCSVSCKINYIQTLPQVRKNHLKGTKKGIENPRFKGGHINKDGRVYLRIKGKQIPRAHYNWMNHNKFWYIPEGFVIHHVDQDKSNDEPINLVLLYDNVHRSLHTKLRKMEA